MAVWFVMLTMGTLGRAYWFWQQLLHLIFNQNSNSFCEWKPAMLNWNQGKMRQKIWEISSGWNWNVNGRFSGRWHVMGLKYKVRSILEIKLTKKNWPYGAGYFGSCYWLSCSL